LSPGSITAALFLRGFGLLVVAAGARQYDVVAHLPLL
jgi:hypothetical protein